ncbi:Beta-lactamase class A [Actinomadura meyerae]|jgi:beta-lactamase class A|uniref:Beta-lactamase class A n=1 Tax=Actinomadura meyerae TaxID=240840 RepID=A0A239D338_9ACTN|nr:serine hydrolase [Actinomadura meyerae]SNS26717.1 Beta-lactamase class A [Actinomadura meyerae]
MRRHIIVLALAAGATGAGLTAHWLVADAPQRKSGATVGAKEAVEPGREAAVANERRTRPFDRTALTFAVRDYLGTRPGRAGIMATDLRTGLSFGQNENGRFVSASVMKVDILSSLVLRHQRGRDALTRGQRDLAGQMIRESDNSAADALYSAAGGSGGVRKANRSLGLKNTTPFAGSWGSSLTTPADQVRLLRTLVSDSSPIKPANRRYILGLMGSVVKEQAWGVSAAARPGEKVALKNGWTPVRRQGHGWTVNSVGRITGRDHDFLVAVCSGESPTMEKGVATVEQVAEMVVSTMRDSHP